MSRLSLSLFLVCVLVAVSFFYYAGLDATPSKADFQGKAGVNPGFDSASHATKELPFHAVAEESEIGCQECGCAGLVATGSVVKDGKSIFWKNRHMSGENNRPSFSQGSVYKYYTIFGKMGMNEKGLSTGNFVAYGSLDTWTHVSDATMGHSAMVNYILGNFDTVEEAANYAASHMSGKGHIGIISRQYGVGAIVYAGGSNGTHNFCNLLWVNNTAVPIANAYYCDGDYDSDGNDATIEAIIDDILTNGGINGDHKIDWEEVCQRGGKNVNGKEQGEGTFSCSGEITKSSCVSGFVAIGGNSSYDGALSMGWLAMGRQPLVGVWLPLGASYLTGTGDIPYEFRAGGGIEDYVDAKVNYASIGGQGSNTYYCARTQEVQAFANHNEDYTFDKYDELMETIMSSADANEAKTRLKAYADNAFDVALYAYEHNFTTPYVPMDAQATTQSQTRIDLSWTKGAGSDRTVVERSTSPGWSLGEGILVCNETGESCSDTGLSPGTHYYYQLWSFTAALGGAYQYSLDYGSADATTLSGGNNPPVFSNPSIADGATGIPVVTSSLSITITDPDGNSFDWSVVTSPDVGISSGSGDSSGVKSCGISGLDYDTTYTWTVSADDGGVGGSAQDSFTFTTEAGPADSSFSRRISVDHGYIDNVLTGFPVLVHLGSDAHLASNAQPDGDDISFWSFDNSTQYSHEVEHYDGGSGKLYAWVKLPSVSPSSDTEFWMKYGNSSCGSQEDPAGTWGSNFGGVWHLSELDAVDSTGNGNTGVHVGGPVVSSGIVHKAVDFTPTNEIDLGTGGSIDMSDSDEFTVEFWANFDSDSVDQMCFVQSQGSDSWNVGFGTFDADIVNNDMKFLHRDIDGSSRDTINASHPGAGSWHHIAGSYANGASDYKALYIDGVLATSTDSGINTIRSGPATSTVIGHGGDFGPMDGRLDEVRVSTVARSAAWVKASYHTVATDGFLTVGSEENAPPVFSSPSPADGSTGVSVELSSLSIAITDPDGNSFDWSVVTSPDVGSSSGSGESSGIKSCPVSGLDHGMTYSWTVSADDGSSLVDETFGFTTENFMDSMPEVSLISPPNSGSTTDTTPAFSYKVNDTDNTTVTCTLYIDGSPIAISSAVSDGSTVNSITPSSALSYATHSWRVSCTDGNNTGISSSWSLTVKQGGSGGGGGTGGGGGGGEPPAPKYNITYNFSRISEDEIKTIIETTQGIQEALLGAGFDSHDPDTLSQLAVATKKAYDKCNVTMGVSRPTPTSTQIDVTVACSSPLDIKDLVVFIEIPKSFAESSNEVSVTTIPPDAKVAVIESDPVYSIHHDELTLGNTLYAFHTEGFLNRDLIAGDWVQPWFFLGDITRDVPPNCGNDVLDDGEECDGIHGVTAGHRCNDECRLELIPDAPKCVGDGVCTEEEEVLGNCQDCAYVPRCVDDLVCSAEEQLLGNCRDCEASPIVLPNELVPAFLWVRASAGTILILGALVLLGALAHVWMKRHEHKKK